jgi:hypothetical protein
MAKLTEDEQKLLDELTQRASEPDEDDSYEIEIYDTSKGRGARVPYRQGKKWLYENFGLGDAPEEAQPDEVGQKRQKKETTDNPGAPAAPQGYFGRQNQGS